VTVTHARLLILAAALALATSGAAGVHARSKLVPPPTFRPSPMWITVTTGPIPEDVAPPQVWAVPSRSDQAGLGPWGFTDGLEKLEPDGIIVWASTIARRGSSPTFVHSRWPLRLSSFRVDHAWETQPAANIQQRLRWVTVAGWNLDVRVYFGTQHPTSTMLRAAQAELDRLRLPG
jgi:hypothetical protein